MQNILNNREMSAEERIVAILQSTGREGVGNVISYMKSHGFFTRHCHSHHHYRGGLADHALQTLACALQSKRSRARYRGLDENSLALCAILHDICDCRDHTIARGHGWRSLKMLRNCGLDLSEVESAAIRCHMGLGSHSYEEPYYHYLKENDALCSCIHHADGKSASLRWGRAPRVNQA